MSKNRKSNQENQAEQAVNDRKYFLAGLGEPEPAPFIVDGFQKTAIDYIAKGDDVLVVAPTGSGKTFIAIQAIEIALQTGLRAVYTTPLKALSNTKFADLKKKFEPHYKVGLLTGDRKIESDAQVVVATTEIYRNELYAGGGNFAYVILDEVHFIAEPQRGPVWEESIILSPKEASLLMLSASISNAYQIAEWVSEIRGKTCQVIIEEKRPVELRFGFLHPVYGVMPLTHGQNKINRLVEDYYQFATTDNTGTKLKRNRKLFRDKKRRR